MACLSAWETGGCALCEGASCQSTCQRCEGCLGCQSSCQRGCQSSCERGCQSGAEKNVAPSRPNTLTVSEPVKYGEDITISWGVASDTNLSGYHLERSLDNGSYTRIYTGTAISYVDNIPKGQYKTVRYRVRGYDKYTTGPFATSKIYEIIYNSPPTISGNDLDLGSKTKDFTIEYTVTDDKESRVSVEILLNTNSIYSSQVTTGIRNTYKVNILNLDLGKHTISIKAKDSEGAESVRTLTFTKINSAPIISDRDRDLGEMNSSFSISYRVDDEQKDKVNVTEKLNGKIISVRENVTLSDIESESEDGKYTITIPSETLMALPLNEENTITIEAEDAYKGTAYRRYTFKRTNTPPTISGADKDLGEKEKTLSIDYSGIDLDGDAFFFEVLLDGQTDVERFKAEDNKTYTYEVPWEKFRKLSPGGHNITIVAEDELGFRSERRYAFTAVAKRLVAMTAKIQDAGSTMPTRAVPSRVVSLASPDIELLEICNNAFDEEPTWEDCTAVAKSSKPFFFQNKTKTADKWGVRLRITITENKSNGRSYLSGLGGSYE